MKKFYSLLTMVFCGLMIQAQLNVTYQGNITYNQELSDIWGYVAPDDTEYGLVGVFNGVSIVDLTDPTNPTEIFFLEGANSTWRDIKTWGEYAYVTNETSNGVMVIDLTDLPNSVSSFDWTPNISGLGQLSSCHNIFIDEFGYAFLVGCNLNGGGMLYVDCFTTPGEPDYVGKGPNTYSHDVYVRNNLAYSSEIGLGQFAIYDVADKDNTILLGDQATASGATHNAWLSDDSTILYTTDEVGNAPVGSYDVSDPSDILELDQFVPLETLGMGVIPHNVHVFNDWLIISYYTDGCIIVDGSNPDNLVEVGNFDTFIPEATGFAGAWGAYPFLPSGLILVSDIGNGMYVLAPTYVNACWLEGNITNADTSDPIFDASIVLEGTNVVDQSDLVGAYATGYAISGTYDVTVSKPGFEPTTASADLENGVITILDVELVPLIPFSVSGMVIDDVSGDPIPNAKVSIENQDWLYEVDTDAGGAFVLPTFFEGSYDIYAGKWGHTTSLLSDELINEGNNTITIEIGEGYEDVFSLDLGWNVGFSGYSGAWERGVSIGLMVGGLDFYLTPNEDESSDIGNHCYVTGNSPDLFSGVLISGSTELNSPSFDLTSYENPWISYSTWFLSVFNDGSAVGGELMLVSLDNGIESVIVDTIAFPVFDAPAWMFRQINVAEHLPPTDNMHISFETSAPLDFSSVVEAGVDHFKVWEGVPDGIEVPTGAIQFAVYPNPSSENFRVAYSLENYNPTASLVIYNAVGQQIEERLLGNSNGFFNIGQAYESGIYFARIFDGKNSSKTLKLIKQ